MKLILEFDDPKMALPTIGTLLGNQAPLPQATAATLDAGASGVNTMTSLESRVQSTSPQGMSAGIALAEKAEASQPPAPHGDTFGLGQTLSNQPLEMDAGAGRG